VLDVELFTEMAPPVETLSWEEAMSRGLLGGDFAPSPPAESEAALPGPAEASGPAETLTWEEAMSRGLLGGDLKA
jgi:hypothetical protein